MYRKLQNINNKPIIFSQYSTDRLWTETHRAKQILQMHLNKEIEAASRNTEFINTSTEWIINHFNLSPRKSICDFGCAVGFYTTPFARTGAKVTGIDFSQNSLNYAIQKAKKDNLDISYKKCNYLDFSSTEKFDLITMIMCDFCALSLKQREKLLQTFYTHLKPTGSILLDVFSLQAFNQKQENYFYGFKQLDGFWAAQDYYTFVNTFKYEPEKVSLDKYTIITETATETVYNWLQYFTKESIKAEFTKANLQINEFYSDIAGTEYSHKNNEFAIIANKK